MLDIHILQYLEKSFLLLSALQTEGYFSDQSICDGKLPSKILRHNRLMKTNIVYSNWS